MTRPLSNKTMLRFTLVLLMATAFMAGLYRTKLILLQKEYDLVENRYVRVREILGRDKTQELINESYYNQGIDPPNSEIINSPTGSRPYERGSQ